ncbi:Guanine nucleotide-binding protein subunit gamma 1 [Umbelopsis nana]
MSGYPRASQNRRTQNLSENKLKRIIEYNARLKEQLDIPRVRVSEASQELIAYCKGNRDPLVPSVWGPVDKKEDPFAPVSSGGCCIVM